MFYQNLFVADHIEFDITKQLLKINYKMHKQLIVSFNNILIVRISNSRIEFSITKQYLKINQIVFLFAIIYIRFDISKQLLKFNYMVKYPFTTDYIKFGLLQWFLE